MTEAKKPILSLVSFDTKFSEKIFHHGQDPTYWQNGPHPVPVDITWRDMNEPEREVVDRGNKSYKLSCNKLWSGSYHENVGWAVYPMIDLSKRDAASRLDDQVHMLTLSEGSKYLIFSKQNEKVTDPRVLFTPQMITARISASQEAYIGANAKHPDKYPKPSDGNWRIASEIPNGTHIVNVFERKTLYVAKYM